MLNVLRWLKRVNLGVNINPRGENGIVDGADEKELLT